MRIGIDLGGTKIEGIVMDDAGAVLERRRTETPAHDYGATIAAIAAMVAILDGYAGVRCRVGVATPGARSPTSGRMKNANSTVLNGRTLLEDLEGALAREVRLANDADCFALSEATDGAGAGAHSVFGVIVGTGTGAGVVVRGHLLAGPNAIAGEWGHNCLPWPEPDELPGPTCYCGRKGCIETFLSGPGLLRDYLHRREVNGSQASADVPSRVEQVLQSAAAGDEAARQSLGRYYDRMARGLAHVINLVDPEVIVLGGGLSNLDALYREVPDRWGQYVFSDNVHTQLRRPRYGDSSGVRGAAWLWPVEPV